jgi:hypothetical protein
MTDSNTLEQALKICRNLLEINISYSQVDIADAVQRVGNLLSLDQQDMDILRKRLQFLEGIDQRDARILEKSKIDPWVVEKWSRKGQARKFWKRYYNYLGDEKKIAPKVLIKLDQLTNKILDHLADPEGYDEFDKRGLVVGHVQSGKTSNYLGLITKAADAGYKIIIILAGIHNSLRSQTQLRVDEGFLGYDTITSRISAESSNRIGVGKYDRDCAAQSLTTSAPNGDFKKSLKDVNFYPEGPIPTIVVIKKNNAVLKNLIDWLAARLGQDSTEGRIIEKHALMLIDDEADNASINISKASVSSINGSIRALLRLFRKSAYVGYTATPYANVFIPPPDPNEQKTKGLKIVSNGKDYPVGDDLFPSDFIINLSAPSNYIGAERFFGIINENSIYEEIDLPDEQKEVPNAIIHLYRPVEDHQPRDYGIDSVTEQIREVNHSFIPDKHKLGDTKPADIPESLQHAIKCFILACAARRLRNQTSEHNSMLVHVTRFVDWQNHIALLVEDQLNIYKNYIDLRNRDFIAELKTIWENEFTRQTNEIISAGLADEGIILSSWEEVELELYPAVYKIQVRAVHGSKLLGGLEPANIEALDYYEHRKNGLSVIAVGGNKLSRGLTLEGLTVSYFLRSSKMYDTLMQMGRWFGYRPGYLDLCRLFTTFELVGHYKHITRATEEMRGEFDRMALLHKRPDQYGLKVRAHDGVLTITAANKFRYKKMMYFSYAGQLEETWQFDKTMKNKLLENYEQTMDFIRKLGVPTGPRNKSRFTRSQKLVWYAENNAAIVADYLLRYNSSQPSFRTKLISEYITNQTKIGKLINWTIVLISNTLAKQESKVQLYDDELIGMSYRSDSAEPGSPYYELVKSHIIGNFHEYIDLDDIQLEQALEETRGDRIQDGKEPICDHPNPARIRKCREETNGLLLIYALDPNPRVNYEAYLEVPIVGLALSFPQIENDEKVIYAVNEVFKDELYDYPDELDNEALDNEEEEEGMKIKTERIFKLSAETFVDMIENNRHTKLDVSEFRSGIVPRYKERIEEPQLEELSNLIVDIFVEGSMPFYSEGDIQQFYLNEQVSQYVLNPEPKGIAEGTYLVGLKRSKYVTFSYHEGEAVFSDSCWVIQSPRFEAKYLIAVFNSSIFGGYLRTMEEEKRGTYFVKSEILYKFPLIPPDHSLSELFAKVYDILEAIAKKENQTGRGIMKSYFTSILDALVFGLYFPVSLEKTNEKLIECLVAAMPETMFSGDKLADFGIKLFTEFYDRKHPVREILYALDNNNKVARIRSIFSQ